MVMHVAWYCGAPSNKSLSPQTVDNVIFSFQSITENKNIINMRGAASSAIDHVDAHLISRIYGQAIVSFNSVHVV